MTAERAIVGEVDANVEEAKAALEQANVVVGRATNEFNFKKATFDRYTGLSATGVGVVFGPGTTAVTGALVANAGSGTITQTGALTVTGTSGLTAGGAITLANGANNMFGGTVTASGASIDVEAKTSLDVAPTLGVGGSLALVANGASSTLTINGLTNINTTGDVTLSAGADRVNTPRWPGDSTSRSSGVGRH